MYWRILLLMSLMSGCFVTMTGGEEVSVKPIALRAWGVPSGYKLVIRTQADFHVLQAFRERYPHIHPVSSTGLQIPGGNRTADFVPFMQIAGDIPPDVLGLTFRHSHTYIQNKLLYPLDKYVEGMLGIKIENGPDMSLDAYLTKLKESPSYTVEIKQRFPEQCWQVIRRLCPYAEQCPYSKKWNLHAKKKHYHIWCWPQSPLVSAL